MPICAYDAKTLCAYCKSLRIKETRYFALRDAPLLLAIAKCK